MKRLEGMEDGFPERQGPPKELGDSGGNCDLINSEI